MYSSQNLPNLNHIPNIEGEDSFDEDYDIYARLQIPEGEDLVDEQETPPVEELSGDQNATPDSEGEVGTEPAAILVSDVGDQENPLLDYENVVFGRLQDVMDCYYLYARNRGFQCSINGIDYDRDEPPDESKPWDADAIRGRFHCSKAGKFTSKKKNPRRSTKTTKTDCLAKLNAWRNKDRTWRVSKMVDEHNHPLFPESVGFMPRFRYISPRDKGKLLLNKKAGIPTDKNYQSMVMQYNGYKNVPFSNKDCRNMFDKERRLCLKEGDFAAMRKYFDTMSKDCSDFVYAYDTNDEGRLRNVFWVDGRSRAAFKDFGDVVSFDATYLKNRYRMPFTPFIGVNQHGQSILLGCALLSSEDTRNFTWLFQQWKNCMHGKSPKGIVTDQCPAIGKALLEVLPETKQRWCLWHVMNNAKKHLQSKPQWEEIQATLKSVLHNSLTIGDFYQGWTSLLTAFNLENNRWLRDMYNKRKMWVPVYFRGTFWAGMSTTQGSEGMNNFFRSFVNLNSTLFEFANQFSLAFAKRAHDEARETFDSINRPLQLCSDHKFEEVFQEKYTNQKFVELQDEIKSIPYMVPSKIIEVDGTCVFNVVDRTSFCLWVQEGGVPVKVVLQRTPCKLLCECKNFEFRGILCRHILVIMHREGIDYVPHEYVLDRWCKDITQNYLKFLVPHYNPSNVPPEPASYRLMSDKFEDVVHLFMGKDDLMKEFMAFMEEMKVKALSTEDASSRTIASHMNGVG